MANDMNDLVGREVGVRFPYNNGVSKGKIISLDLGADGHVALVESNDGTAVVSVPVAFLRFQATEG